MGTVAPCPRFRCVPLAFVGFDLLCACACDCYGGTGCGCGASASGLSFVVISTGRECPSGVSVRMDGYDWLAPLPVGGVAMLAAVNLRNATTPPTASTLLHIVLLSSFVSCIYSYEQKETSTPRRRRQSHGTLVAAAAPSEGTRTGQRPQTNTAATMTASARPQTGNCVLPRRALPWPPGC